MQEIMQAILFTRGFLTVYVTLSLRKHSVMTIYNIAESQKSAK